jgi:hypothetical protein
MRHTLTHRFHGSLDDRIQSVIRAIEAKEAKEFTVLERDVRYNLHLHQHPYVQELMGRLLRTGIAGLQESDTEYVRQADGSPDVLPDGKPRPVLHAPIFSRYDPSEELVRAPHPVNELEFTTGGAYAVYNWELFFHVPLTIALHLSKNQRFAEAQHWFHFVFDPTDDSDLPAPERFWKVRPFRQSDTRKLEETLVNLSTGADSVLRDATVRSIEAWRSAPFRPHVIARYRQEAYKYKAVMAYLDNLIAWGDSLFRQDTGEAIDEALQLYVLAANILGPRPQQVPKKGSVRPQTYRDLRGRLDSFGNALRNLEAEAPFDLLPFPADEAGKSERLATLRSLGRTLYFRVPQNEKLLGYWDTVADRLFKIRNSLNIQGVFRQLALFEPPIDPALLARAAAAGLEVGAIANGLHQPLPLVRFPLLVQKASEIAQEVKSLGGSLLAAMEKEDGEALAILRAKHERAILEMVEQARYAQLQEAIKSREGLLQSLALAVQRYTYYERHLGRKDGEIEKAFPELGELDMESLARMRFAMREPEVGLREIKVDIARGYAVEASQGLSGGNIRSSQEVAETDFLVGAQAASYVSSLLNVYSSTLHTIPTVKIHSAPWGVGGEIEKEFGREAGSLASAARAIADSLSFQARQASRMDSFVRREQEWAFQSNLAAGEINQIFKQLSAAQIREAVAELELKSHRQQMRHAEEIERFLNEEGTERMGKKTNRALYSWMKRETRGLYGQCFQLAFEVARKAERAMQHELGDPELRYLQLGYLAGREGLLAGEKLYLDLKRMEMAYHELNRREYELTKHVSLLQVDPLALLRLRATGRCSVRLPEALFDMDGPGHYFRRIKTVAVSIPCVTGPYVNVNCKLTLLRSSIRKTPVIGESYTRTGPEDERFHDYFGSLQSVVASSSQQDSGLFEANLRDERYLPFENSGVESDWQLELPANPYAEEPQQFDYNTISDVILHIRYTAREGGEPLRSGALGRLKELIGDAQAAGSVRLFSMRHEFPSEWARFTAVELEGQAQEATLTFALREQHYPFWAGKLSPIALHSAMLLAEPDEGTKETITVATGAPDSMRAERKLKIGGLGALRVAPLGDPLPPAIGELTLHLDDNSMRDLWLVLRWGSE